MTDIVPIFRLRRRPYFIFAGLVGSIAMLIPAFSTNLPAVCAILSFMTAGAGVAIADVTIDAACVTENSISHPSLAGDMQSLCGVSSSIGQLVGFGLSGVLVHIMGYFGWIDVARTACPQLFSQARKLR
ncbi:putative major facilitator superfamily domain, MFS transporter superfamily [Helianthus annuus]|nr:putative major facilitator superfamily domain, MFS transporter superfamily [Helianthus annuus]